MKIVQSTWVRYHHFDLAKELYEMGHLKEIFTCLPWWKAKKESDNLNIPRELITCNFLVQGIRRVAQKLPLYTIEADAKLAVAETKFFSKWVAKNLPVCDCYIGISGTGLHAGRVAKERGAGYVMDRGSTQIRYADRLLENEHARWNLPWSPIHPWLIENEEAEQEEANIITVPSDFVKNTFIHEGTNPNKLRVIPYGVSLKEFYPDNKKDIDQQNFNIVFVGQFSIRKGAPYLLEAFKAFDHPSKRLTVIGHVAENVKQLIKNIGSTNVNFVGTVPRADVRKYLSQAHVLVLPSLEEGLALVQAQALSCGCPIIATPNTGSETLFDNGKEGLIIPARDSNAIKEALTFLADNTHLLHSMREAAIKKASALGGWRNYANTHITTAQEAKSINNTK